MGDSTGEAFLNGLSFRFGVFGNQLISAFNDRIAELGLTHKQVGLLALVDAGLAQSQKDIADHLNVAPSLVVNLADKLVESGAIRRVRSSNDRRVQIIELTAIGKELLASAQDAARRLDEEVRASLSPAGRKALELVEADLLHGLPRDSAH